jgi:hypothetical protein
MCFRLLCVSSAVQNMTLQSPIYAWVFQVDLLLRFPHQNPVYTSPLPHMCYMPRPSHSSPFDYYNNVGWGVQVIKLIKLCSCLHSPVTSFPVGPNIFLSILFSNTLSLRFSLKVSNQISYPYKTTGRIIVLHILIFVLWDSKLEY